MSKFHHFIGDKLPLLDLVTFFNLVTKTKVMIFNKRGLKLDKKYSFSLGDKSIEITDEYQYLGIKLRPSGSFSLAVQELNDKASRAWFGISNIILKNKQMHID